jgi:hypothetical protein
MKNCNCHYEIPRDGSGQLGRYLQALDPNYAPVDGRSIEDLLVFAKRYAAQIRFYDVPGSNVEDGADPAHVSWREFFRRDMAVIAASMSVVDTAKLKRDYDENRRHLEAHPDSGALNDLFDPILGMIVQLDRWYSLAIQENPLHADLQLAIDSTLRGQVKKIVAYEAGYKYVDPKHPLQLDFSAVDNDDLWGREQTIEPDPSIYQGETLGDKIRHAALYVDDVFHAVYGFIVELVEVKSVEYLRFALEAYPAHQPHMALFIAFLELFRLAQEQMNGLTGRMLDFYYKDVLRLEPRPPIPDRVHIVFELAKDVVQYDLVQGTALKAGKDASGKEQLYATEGDLVINRAKVKELKTVFIQKTTILGKPSKGTVDAIFARPIANSFDGFGEKITDPSGKWPTFGQGLPTIGKPKNICQAIDKYKEIASRKDQAKIGFALASPQLLLQGGNRLIRWNIPGLKEQLQKSGADMEIWLTGEKGWLKVGKCIKDETTDETALFKKILEVEASGVFDPKISLVSRYYLNAESDALYIYLPIAEVAVVPFDSKLHGGYPYVTDYPVAQVMLGPKLNIGFDDFKSLRFAGQSLSVRVGSIKNTEGNELYFDGLKTVVLQNETGLVDANKPFDPFTLYPSNGKSFYIGSAEVFNKPLVQLAVDIKNTQDQISINNDGIETVENTDAATQYSVSVLAKKQWDRIYPDAGNPYFDRGELAKNVLHGRKGEAKSYPRIPIESSAEYISRTVKGFIRIDLFQQLSESQPPTHGFSANISAIQASQDLAPKLQIKELSLSYHSELAALSSEIDQFFHVYPFGVAEIYLGRQESAGGENSAKTDSVAPRRATRLTWIQDSFSKLNQVAQNPSFILNPSLLGLFQPRKTFNEIDAEKNYLLVDARRVLLPQFTFRNPNVDFLAGSPSVEAEADAVAGDAASSRDELMNQLVYTASGLAGADEGGNNQYSGDLQEEGLLFIGLENLQPLDTLTLLFQFAEGSAADEDSDPPEIHWSYLTDNEWRPLPEETLISDGTYGFQTTGIVKIDVPENCTDRNTIITDGLRWFCAGVTEHSERIPMLVNVVAQAVEAKFQDNGNAPSHFDAALPAGSIGKLAVAVAQVGKIEQPFASFDGKHAEVGKEFHTRISERLRHKGRAITPWDYERLVLDRFPTIYKVKCVTHTDPNCLCRTATVKKSGRNEFFCCGSQVAPGHVLIVPIADLKNRNAVNPLQPKTARRTLLEIEGYLAKRTSPFVHVHAKNPFYEQILVSFKVRFAAGKDKGYHLKKLNDEIVRYLTPWAFDANAGVSFAQKFYASAIVNFIEERDYVDFITDFYMFVCRDECCPAAEETGGGAEAPAAKKSAADALAHISGCCDMEALIAGGNGLVGVTVAEPSTPRSILVSAPKHIIVPYEPPPREPSACEKRKSLVAAAAAKNAAAEKAKMRRPTESAVNTPEEAVAEKTLKGSAVKTKTPMQRKSRDTKNK